MELTKPEAILLLRLLKKNTEIELMNNELKPSELQGFMDLEAKLYKKVTFDLNASHEAE